MFKIICGSHELCCNTKEELLESIDYYIKKYYSYSNPNLNSYDWWVDNCFSLDPCKDMRALMYKSSDLGIAMYFKYQYFKKYGNKQLSFFDLGVDNDFEEE